jgi:hypothetical protein
MEDDRSTLPTPKRTPWNKGKLIGAKPPLLARHVWSIRTKLQIERRTRDLAMFNLAIDSKLRGCDVIYSITSSARRSTDGGTVRPRASAVLKFTTSSNFVGCSTGRSAGLAPLRTLAMMIADCRHIAARLGP